MAFDTLKKFFTSEPILRHFDPSLSTVLETDASDRVISAVLSQFHTHPNSTQKLHPIAYFSRTMTPAELNYTVGDKELLAIVESLREYRQYICNLASPIRIITDHQNLTAFTTKRILNGRQARWALELAEIDFLLEFRPGCKNSRADALTRRSEDVVQNKGQQKPLDLIITPQKFADQSFSNISLNSNPFCSVLEAEDDIPALIFDHSLVEEFRDSLASDSFAQEIIKALRSASPRHSYVDLGSCHTNEDGILFVAGMMTSR
ncbi:hypothetical protein K3495_g16051 [Podosphaera aphanis]|nr:hypothetical protein K3495_g16051 [Podosphaera aphanis]